MTRQQSVLLGGFLTLFGIALIISFASYMVSWENDQSIVGSLQRSTPADNYLSHLGNTLGHLFIYNGFGLAAFILAGLFVVSGLYLFFNLATRPLRKYWFWGLYLMIWTSLVFGFLASSNPMLGGVVGFEISDVLQGYMGATGLGLTLGFTGLIYLVLRLKWTPDRLMQWLKNRPRKIKGTVGQVNDSMGDLNRELNGESATIDEEQPQTVNFDQDPENDTTSDQDQDLNDDGFEDTFEEKHPEPELQKTFSAPSVGQEDDVSLEIETTKEEVP